MDEAWILVVDDNEQSCTLCKQALSSCGMQVTVIKNPLLVAAEIQKRFYNVIILDVFKPEMLGLNLLSGIGKRGLSTKVILMADDANIEISIKALRMGAFDFLEKPISQDLLYYAVKRALHVQQTEMEHQKALEELFQKNRELEIMNKALSELMSTVESIRQITEKKILNQIKSLIASILGNFKNDKNLEELEYRIENFMNYIETMTSNVSTDSQPHLPLSTRELRMLLMIKDGMTSQEIAGHLNISFETVKTHRRNIRKKLGITGTKIQLSSHLTSLT
jgi:FixJ family two-component response regulator